MNGDDFCQIFYFLQKFAILISFGGTIVARECSGAVIRRETAWIDTYDIISQMPTVPARNTNFTFPINSYKTQHLPTVIVPRYPFLLLAPISRHKEVANLFSVINDEASRAGVRAQPRDPFIDREAGTPPSLSVARPIRHLSVYSRGGETDGRRCQYFCESDDSPVRDW